MYRDSSDYAKLDQLAIDVYLDYGINKFPLDEQEICRKLGISLVPYSAYEDEKELLLKKSSKGFLSPPFANRKATIFYNDDLSIMKSWGSVRQTIFHEIKHYVNEDYYEDDPEDDDLAEHFGRFFSCPTPYLVKHNITDVNEIISTFDVSSSVAGYAASNVISRMNVYGQRIFDYEQPLIDLLDKEE